MGEPALILLDTHAWIWWLDDPGRLSPRAEEYMATAARESRIFLSAISVWETAILVKKGRLKLDRPIEDWMASALSRSSIQTVPIDSRIALRSVRLPEPFHADPADRLIVATAEILELPLVTKDQRLQDWEGVQTIW